MLELHFTIRPNILDLNLIKKDLWWC